MTARTTIRRTVQYGYRVEECHHIECGPTKDFTAVLDTALLDRKPIAVSLGPIVAGYARPKADNCDGYSQLVGASKRVCRLPNPRRFAESVRFAQFVQGWLDENVAPIVWTQNIDLESYLRESHYSRARKDALRSAYAARDPAVFDLEYRQAKCFIKDESYETFKAPRWIMSRCEGFKAEFGPYIHFAEKVVYSLPYFVKSLTPKERIRKLQNMDLTGENFWTTDHSAFEAAMTVETMMICEMALLDHLYRNHPQYLQLRKNLDNVVGRENHLVCSHAVIDGIEARMSGDNHTSLGNGFTNLMAIKYALHKKGVDDTPTVVEGDDALFSSKGVELTTKDFQNIGFEVKMISGPVAPEQGFCGLVADPTTGDAITEPLKVIMNFGWTSKQYLFSSDATHRALIRAKAMSYGYMYPACPIISALAKRYLELTEDVRHYKMVRVIQRSSMSLFEKQKVLDAIHHKIDFHEPAATTRQLFEHLFGYSVAQQREFEDLLRKSTFGPITIPPHLMSAASKDCEVCWDNFVISYPHTYGCPPLVDLRDVRELRYAEAIPRKLTKRS